MDQLDLNVCSVELLLNRFPGNYSNSCINNNNSGRSVPGSDWLLCLHRRSDRGGVPPPAGRVRYHWRAGHEASGQPVRRTEEPGGLRTDDDAMVTAAADLTCRV